MHTTSAAAGVGTRGFRDEHRRVPHALLCLLLALALHGCALPQPRALVDFSQRGHPADSLVGSFVWLDIAE